MVRSCVVYGCNNLHNPQRKISFHVFPFKKPELLDLWIKAVRRENWYPSKTSAVCGLHFLESDYLLRPGYSLRLLKPDAVPSVFPTYPKHLYSKTNNSTRRILKRPELYNPAIINIENAMEVVEAVLENPSPIRIDRETQTAGVTCSGNCKYRNKVKLLKEKLRRRDKKITNIKELIARLSKNCYSDENLNAILKSYFSGFHLELLIHEKNNSTVGVTKRRYTELMKNFAHTLYFYSPKAYRFVRQHFTLPTARTLRMWLSRVDCQPGLLKEVFDFLKVAVHNQPNVRECALIFDSMAIRKQILWNHNAGKFEGYVNYAGIVNVDPEEVATEALCFQIVSYTGNFKCPVAYFLINKCPANLQAQLVLACLKSLSDVGINIRSLTCDGTATNLATLSLLGCDFNTSGNLISHFPHPIKKHNIYCMLDACHMLKLARNCFAEKKLRSNDGAISFEYLKKLDVLQKNLKLKLANTLSSSHINYKNKIMNVRLAAQTISSGVADALQFLQIQNEPGFLNCNATVQFIRIIDRMFDILNTRNPFGKGFKAPIRPSTLEYFEQVFEESSIFLRSLEIDNLPLLHHSRKTFAVGFIMTMQSTLCLANDLFNLPNKPVRYLMTYKCSQDHLELFFSCIRSRGGWNNNPNCQQLRWALRQLLFRNSIKSSATANCSNFESLCTPIVEFRSNNRSIVSEDDTIFNATVDNILMGSLIEDNVRLNVLHENIIFYISGFVVRCLMKTLNCNFCYNIVFHKPKLEQDHSYSVDLEPFEQFCVYINRGGLIRPSEVVFKIILFTEKVFRTLETETSASYNFKLKLVNIVVNHFGDRLHMFMPNHPVCEEFAAEDLHELQLVKAIVNIFVKCRMHHHAKSVNLKLHGNSATVRQKLTKQILFNNC